MCIPKKLMRASVSMTIEDSSGRRWALYRRTRRCGKHWKNIDCRENGEQGDIFVVKTGCDFLSLSANRGGRQDGEEGEIQFSLGEEGGWEDVPLEATMILSTYMK